MIWWGDHPWPRTWCTSGQSCVLWHWQAWLRTYTRDLEARATRVCGTEGEWIIGSCEPISKMPEGTIFSFVEERSRSLTRASDTSCMVEGDSDAEREARGHLTFGSRKTLTSKVPRDCWNCRVFHSTAVQNSFKRLERFILCCCGFLNCGNPGSYYDGDKGAVYQSVFGRSQDTWTSQPWTFMPISTSTRWNCCRFGARGRAMNLVSFTSSRFFSYWRPDVKLFHWAAGTDALSLSWCSPADTCCFKTFVRRSNRAQHTKHRDSSGVAQALWWHSGQCALWLWRLQTERTAVLQPYFYTRRKTRATKGADPRTEHTTTRAKSWSWRNRTWRLSWSCAGQQIILSRESRGGAEISWPSRHKL